MARLTKIVKLVVNPVHLALSCLFLLVLPFTSYALTISERTQAVIDTIDNNDGWTSTCGISDFYWEIGDQSGTLASGTHKNNIDADTHMSLYSAGKWLYGAYVYEKRGGNLLLEDKMALRMSSGYIENSGCIFKSTVDACYAVHDEYTPEAYGKFKYAAGHFQKNGAVDLEIGSLNKIELRDEMMSYLGAEVDITVGAPLLSGGFSSTPATYAKFLRRMLDGSLLLGQALGDEAVCTQPGTCPTYYQEDPENPDGPEDSFMPFAWDYSWGHWVENDPDAGDGSFSSPGLGGFYPWIDANKTFYGILARHSWFGYNRIPGTSAEESVNCGHLIREAWMTGEPQ